MNRNVKVVLMFTLLWRFTRSLWEANQMSSYIFFLSAAHPDTNVGLAASIEGIAQLLAALPAGYMADRWRRDTVRHSYEP